MYDFTILSKADDYFLAQKGSSHCKIIIDDFSKDLPLGDIRLHVEEISDLYRHYSKEAIFRLTLPLERQHETAICTLSVNRQNTFLYRRCLALSGQWSSVLNEWVFSASVEPQVLEISQLFKSKNVFVEAYFKETVTVNNQPLTIFGFPILTRNQRDNNVNVPKNVKLVGGEVGAAGNEQNKKIIATAGSTFRLWVPSDILEHSYYREDYFCAVTITKKRSPRGKPSFMQ